MYGESFSPDDISQGYIGDCYYLAALSSIAEDHDLFSRIFGQDRLNSNGLYSMNVWVRGVPHEVTVDDVMPMRSWGSGFNFWFNGMGDDGAMWGPIAEKVWAKVNAAYGNIESGSVLEGYYFLTGVPGVYESGITSDATATYNQIHGLATKGSFMSSGSNASTCGNLGIVAYHAYSIFDAYNLSNGECLVHVRNPWSSEQYNGAWSRSDTAWTQSMVDELRSKGAPEHALDTSSNDGDFFMRCSDFSTGFSSLMTIPNADGWKSNFVEDVDDGTGTYRYVYFTNEQTQDVIISFDFWPQRMYANGCASGSTLVYIMLYDDDTGVRIGYYNLWTRYGFNSLHIPDLEPGNYRVYNKFVWGTGYEKKDFMYRVLSPNGVNIDGAQTLVIGQVGVPPQPHWTDVDKRDDLSTSNSHSNSDVATGKMMDLDVREQGSTIIAEGTTADGWHVIDLSGSTAGTVFLEADGL